MKLHKFLIVILTFLLLTAIMVSPIYAAIFSEYLTDDQLRYIVTAENHTGLYYQWYNYFFTNNYGSNYLIGNPSSNTKPLTTGNPVFNYPLFLSNFDTVVVQYTLYRSDPHYPEDSLSILNAQSVNGSVATNLSFEEIGRLGTGSIAVPGSSTSATYYGVQYQITITEPIDYLRITLDISNYNEINNLYLFGIKAIQVIGTSSALQDIDYQVSQIGTKIDALTSAVQNATSDIGAVVDGQGNILTELEDIKDFADSIDQKQDIIIYSTAADQLIISELNERLSEVKDQLDEYKDILDQYYNPPDVSNVTNIIDQGLPNEYNPQAVAPVLSVIFDNSLVTTILIAVLALATMSYVLFGKKG